jgi:hypothetical protein
MRLLAALAVGLVLGIAFAVGLLYLLAWYARRMHPGLIGSVGVDLVPLLIAFIVGFGVGVFWIMRD